MKERKLKLSPEIISFVAAFLLLVGAFLAASLFWWGVLWALLGLILGLVEYLSWKKTGETLSEQFGRLLRERPTVGWSLLGLMATAFAVLIWHLMAMR